MYVCIYTHTCVWPDLYVSTCVCMYIHACMRVWPDTPPQSPIIGLSCKTNIRVWPMRFKRVFRAECESIMCCSRNRSSSGAMKKRRKHTQHMSKRNWLRYVSVADPSHCVMWCRSSRLSAFWRSRKPKPETSPDIAGCEVVVHTEQSSDIFPSQRRERPFAIAEEPYGSSDVLPSVS